MFLVYGIQISDDSEFASLRNEELSKKYQRLDFLAAGEGKSASGGKSLFSYVWNSVGHDKKAEYKARDILYSIQSQFRLYFFKVLFISA